MSGTEQPRPGAVHVAAADAQLSHRGWFGEEFLPARSPRSTSPVTAEHVAELLGLVDDSRSVTVEAGHLVHATEPEAFLRELLRFLDS